MTKAEFVEQYVASKARAWTKTNNEPLDSHHPRRHVQRPSEQHLATWRDEAAQQASCPKE
jgi:hypothetical protein